MQLHDISDKKSILRAQPHFWLCGHVLSSPSEVLCLASCHLSFLELFFFFLPIWSSFFYCLKYSVISASLKGTYPQDILPSGLRCVLLVFNYITFYKREIQSDSPKIHLSVLSFLSISMQEVHIWSTRVLPLAQVVDMEMHADIHQHLLFLVQHFPSLMWHWIHVILPDVSTWSDIGDWLKRKLSKTTDKTTTSSMSGLWVSGWHRSQVTISCSGFCTVMMQAAIFAWRVVSEPQAESL